MKNCRAAIGGLISVVLVSDRSAWVLPSALPLESGLSSDGLAPAGDHPAFFNACPSIRVMKETLQTTPRKRACVVGRVRRVVQAASAARHWGSRASKPACARYC